MEASLAVDIMIFQIEAGQPGIVPAELFLPHEGVQQPLFGDPVKFADQTAAIPHQQLQSGIPFLQDPIGFCIEAGKGSPRRVAIRFLHFQAGEMASVLQLHGRLQIGITGDLFDRRNRLLQFNGGDRPARNQLQDELGGADF